MKSSTFTICLLFLFCWTLNAQKSLLQSGPMLGYSEMMEVLVWVQTKEAANVQMEYWEQGQSQKKLKTEVHQTQKNMAYTLKLIADQVEPSKKYDYQILINGKALKLDYPTTFQTQTLYQWRTDPPNFKMALGSCAYNNEPKYDRPGKGYGGDYQIFASIKDKNPDFMLWLGDNTYFREVDWYTWTGILHRHTHTRALPELQPLLASTHHYAIWDDHDFGPNDSDRSFIHKDKTKKAFDLFWGNPSSGLPANDYNGITTQFQWNDIDFFLLDNRYFRSPNRRKTGEATILGKEQLEWLIDALVSSRASFKMVAIGGQVLTTVENWETYIHNHAEERAYLLKRIEEENLKNVVFLTGDRHHTELSKIVNSRGNAVYDLTVSPLTSGSGSLREEINKNRVEGTLRVQRNFGTIEVTGTWKERQLKMEVFDTDGKLLWTQEIMREE